MKRTVITVDGNGRLSIPSNLEDLWMSESELIDMLRDTSLSEKTTTCSISVILTALTSVSRKLLQCVV